MAAFTLVELLVVVAIITILAAVLLPVLAAAKVQARRIQCISNEKQMILAWAAYCADNDDRLVLNGGDTATTSTTAHLWVHGGNHGTSDSLTNAAYLTGQNFSLFAYTKIQPAGQIYKCPADASNWPIWDTSLSNPSDWVPELRSYSLNCYMGITPALDISPLKTNTAYRIYAKSSQVAADSPANRFVFADVNPASICTPGYGVDMTLATWIHYPSYLHRQRGVWVFSDGHAEGHRWTDGRTMVNLGSGTYIPHGGPADGNQDLAWIASQTTSKK